jgi:5-methylthioribose kinase
MSKLIFPEGTDLTMEESITKEQIDKMHCEELLDVIKNMIDNDPEFEKTFKKRFKDILE